MFNGNYGGYSLADIAAATGNNNNNGWGGEGSWWIIILFLLFANGGWGGFGGFGGGFGNMALGYDFPWLLNGQQGINANTNAGFNQAATQSVLGDITNAITSGFGNVQTSLCSGFAGVNATVNGAQNAIAQQLYTNQISDLQQAFNSQTAITGAINGLSAQQANCCCENRLAVANLGSDIAREACADRAAVNDGVRDILANQNAGIQRIIDKLCDQELQAERRDNANLRSELMYARGQASQIDQTAQILANNNAQTALFQQGLVNEVDALYNRLNNCPVATVPVYGRQPIFSCGNSGCGCGQFS